MNEAVFQVSKPNIKKMVPFLILIFFSSLALAESEQERATSLETSETNKDVVEDTLVWECSMLLSTDAVLTLTAKPQSQTGIVKASGVLHEALYSIEGIDKRWDFGNRDSSGAFNYSIVVNPAGMAAYYDFSRVKKGEGVEASQVYRCNQR